MNSGTPIATGQSELIKPRQLDNGNNNNNNNNNDDDHHNRACGANKRRLGSLVFRYSRVRVVCIQGDKKMRRWKADEQRSKGAETDQPTMALERALPGRARVQN